MFAPRGWLEGRGNRAMYRTISHSGLFEKGFYRQQTESLWEKLSDPIWHYLRVGSDRGLDPCRSFDTSFYREWNRDVAQAGINPFEHYLSYGREEGRPPVKPLAAWQPDLTRALEPIRFYNSVTPTKSRVSVVIDASTPQRWPGDPEVLVLASAWIAHGLGRDLRVLLRAGAPDITPIARERVLWPDDVPSPAVTRVPEGTHYSDIEKHDDEVFLGTSWSSTTVMWEALGGARLGYLVLDDESATLPAGEARRRAAAALHLPGVTTIANPHVAKSLGLSKARSTGAITSDSALEYSRYLLGSERKSGGSLVIWSGDQPDLSHTRLALEAVEKVIQSGALDPASTPMTVAGTLEQRLLLLGTHQFSIVSPTSAHQVVSLLAESTAVIALGGAIEDHPVALLSQRLGVPVVSGMSETLTQESVVHNIVRSLTSEAPTATLASATEKLADLETFATLCKARWA